MPRIWAFVVERDLRELLERDPRGRHDDALRAQQPA
jgi:hypothetical protein